MSAVQDLEFTQDWLSPHVPAWEWLFSKLPIPTKILEIGSFEGRSACWFLQNALSTTGTLYCIDTWEGSPEFERGGVNPIGAYERFCRNTEVAKKANQEVVILHDQSIIALSGLIYNEHPYRDGGHLNTFDVIYIDGSHAAIDVLADACMSWPLLKVGGIMIFDDYTFCLEDPIEKRPKAAIDAFAMLVNSKVTTPIVRDQYVIQKLRS